MASCRGSLLPPTMKEGLGEAAVAAAGHRVAVRRGREGAVSTVGALLAVDRGWRRGLCA